MNKQPRANSSPGLRLTPVPGITILPWVNAQLFRVFWAEVLCKHWTAEILPHGLWFCVGIGSVFDGAVAIGSGIAKAMVGKVLRMSFSFEKGLNWFSLCICCTTRHFLKKINVLPQLLVIIEDQDQTKTNKNNQKAIKNKWVSECTLLWTGLKRLTDVFFLAY